MNNCVDFFGKLFEQKPAWSSGLISSGDGFRMLTVSLADMLESAGISSFPGNGGQSLLCRNYFDDWYLYSVDSAAGQVCSLVKLREQEHELELGLEADGDTPGVTVSFVAFDTAILSRCLENSAEENRKKLADEINRVVAWPKQKHHAALKEYFVKPQAKGPYLIAKQYVRHIASLAEDGRIPVPDYYRELYEKYRSSGGNGRIPQFIEANNREGGVCVCDHEHIFVRDSSELTLQEELAMLATHTGNTSFQSFAAEVCFHAKFLVWPAKLRLPFFGSVYASAVRADMSVKDRELQGPQPYYRSNSRLMKQQLRYHGRKPDYNV